MTPADVWFTVFTKLLARSNALDLNDGDVIELADLADAAVVEYARRSAPDYFRDLVNAHLGADESTSAAAAAQPSGDQPA